MNVANSLHQYAPPAAAVPASTLLMMLLATMLSACSPADNYDQPHLKTGKQLFEYHCSGCHGIDGEGRLFRRTPAISQTEMQQSEIAHKLVKGNNGSMPVFENMPRKQAALIANYLKNRLQKPATNR